MNLPHTAIEKTERMRNLLAFLLVGAFISVLPVFTFFVVPDKNKDIVTYMVGQLSGMATMALGFYFVNKVGQDALDATRSENTGKLADAVTTALKSSDSEKAAERAADQVAGAAVDAADDVKGTTTGERT
jgi:hypothetical protein